MVRNIKLFGSSVDVKLRTDADVSVFEEVFVDRDYRMCDDLISKANVVVDVGAHIGCFSVYAAILNSSCKIFAFEPEKENFELLKENLKLNGVRNVVAKNVAVGAERGERELFLSGDSHNHSFVFTQGEKRTVMCTDFLSVIRKVGSCDLVKMDCEGAEFEILMSLGVGDFLKVGAFCVEYHEFDDMKAEKLINLLKNAGFTVEKFPSSYAKNMGFLFAVK